MADKRPIGSAVAGYRLLSLLGEGATGAVYLAERESDGERVALKLLDPELAHDERFRRRLISESKTAAGLDHPHVVPIVDFGESGDVLYLAMRYVEGSDLRALLREEGRMEPERALDLLGQVAGALDAAHGRGLVHRDVKPANILVEQDDVAYLGDFGLVKHADSATSLTGEHAFVGTIAYVSPEQIRGDEVDGRADVYSLGCVLYECLAGEPPFPRESELSVVYAHLNERVPRITEARPDLPAGFDDVIAKATAKEAGERFETCAELVEAGRRALAGERIRRRRLGLTVAAVGLLAGAAVAVVALATSGGGSAPKKPVPRVAVGGNGLALVDPAAARVVGRIALPEAPSEVVFGGTSAWALLPGAQQVAQVDVATRKQVGSVKLPFEPGGEATDGGALFVTEQGGPGVARIDTGTRKVADTWTVDTHGHQTSDPTGIAAGAGSVWVARGAELVRVDARTGKVQQRFPLSVNATLVTFAGGQVWAASSVNGAVEKIDPEDNRSTTVKLHGWISALAVAGDSAYVAQTPDNTVTRLNGDDAGVEQTLQVADGPESLSPAPGAVWVASSQGHGLTRIDTDSGARSAIATTGSPLLARYHDGLLWTVAEAARPPLAAANGPEVRVSVSDSDLQLDPAFGPFPVASQLFYATCLKLVNYPDAAGAPGGVLRPEAATALPSVSADRRTYTFQIRPGLRFSPPSNEVVSAQTFRHSIERALSPKTAPLSAGLHVAGDIVGARAFNARKAPHVRGIVAQGDRLTITLTRPAGDLLSRLAMPIFCAVPTTTPAPGSTTAPIPMAGPYFVRSETPGEIVLDRNPNYRGSRPRRPARIVYLTGVQTAKAVAQAGAGQVDLVTFDFDSQSPLALGGGLSRRYGNDPVAAKRDGSPRYHVAPAPGVDMLAFNTFRPLFKDARVRRAVSYAIDRKAMAGVYNEAAGNTYVPPAVPGSAPSSVYSPSGPDLAKAKALMPAGRTREGSIYTCGEPENVRVAQIVQDDVRPLGIDLSVIQSLGCLRGPDPKQRSADIILATRATPELDPAPFLAAVAGDTSAFGPGLGPATYRDPKLSAKLAQIERLDGAARIAAYNSLEDELLRTSAPFAPFGAFVQPEFMSDRIGCRLIQGAYHVVDLAALCLRKS
jgi:ABC-type transport system substrate-binding protein